MSDIKVSEMPEATELNNNDLLMVIQNGVNKKIKTEKIGGVILFENIEGVKDGITLSDNISNYKEFEVEYFLNTTNQGKLYKSTGRLSTSISRFVMEIMRPTNDYMQIISQIVDIQDNQITYLTSFNYNLNADSTIGNIGQAVHFSFSKVIGYR